MHARAVRNCPWVGALWSAHLLALERTNASEQETAEVGRTTLFASVWFPNMDTRGQIEMEIER